MSTHSRMALVENPAVVCIQGYEDRQEKCPIYASESYIDFPVIPCDISSHLVKELACIITGNVGAIIRGQRVPLMVRYYEIEFNFRGDENTPDSGSIYKFDVPPYFEQHKIIAYGLNFDENDQLSYLSIITTKGLTLYRADNIDCKLKHVASVA
jgi:hypothetical protein